MPFWEGRAGPEVPVLQYEDTSSQAQCQQQANKRSIEDF